MIRERIASEGGSIPFAEFMRLALYAPSVGYYARSEMTTGRSGDFSTSPDVSPAFGQRLAVQAAEMHALSGGGPWRLVELGPGRGLLALDLLDGLARHAPEARVSLAELVLVETSAALRDRQRRRLERADAPPTRWLGDANELSTGPPAVVVANEMLDALPVAAFVRRSAALRELHVAIDERAGFTFVDGPVVDTRAAAIVEAHGLCPNEGERAEACPAVEALFDRLARAGVAGAIFVDYGHEAARLGDTSHAEGTLVAYRAHRVVEDVLADPGGQDITAHVNWTHVEEAARAAGFDVAARVPQDRLLLALGIADDLARVDAGPGPEDARSFARRAAARALVMPGPGGGRRFEALVMTRGVRVPDEGLIGARAPACPEPPRGSGDAASSGEDEDPPSPPRRIRLNR